ncbi:hypothetical protein DESME_09475 [Desulfitobacterium metallireducens DSM 15288]|uniref:Uncharacterized protein n=1 Tax=Desulfitobacterium metallireducens DSM 15288 TaxID=871968 RepID=W0ECJ8_9FIRM|nr:hypothetical protein DESME_09475 [Desulfitobacterium metallireducens DSM 15288]
MNPDSIFSQSLIIMGKSQVILYVNSSEIYVVNYEFVSQNQTAYVSTKGFHFGVENQK